jgi:hypothetical protein
MTTALTSPAASLATALNAPVIDNLGDPRFVLPPGYIFANFAGRVRAVHTGHVHPLGTWSDSTATLVAALAAVRGVA